MEFKVETMHSSGEVSVQNHRAVTGKRNVCKHALN